MSECIICTNTIDAIDRLYCIVACNHNNICNICYMRIRSLQKNFSCMICKKDLEHIICYPKNQSISYTDFEIWGDKLVGMDSVLDLNSQMFYPSEYYKAVISKLWIYQCNVCFKTYRDMKLLKTHVTNEHQMQLCIHCIENKHVFPSEQKIYTQFDYEKHLRHGDNDGSTGHPNCEFCKKRYYDSTALFIHLNKDHFTCHICERNDIKFKYYKDYKSLEQHFRRSHIICEDSMCLAKKYMVFENAIDFELHNRQYHPTFQTKRNTSLKLDFKLARGSQKNNDEIVLKEDSNNIRSSSNFQSIDTTNHSINDSSTSNSNRYEGGLGGKEKDGEWQLEIKPTSTDPRDVDRNTSSMSNNSSEIRNLSQMSSIDEEFPSLKAESNSSNSSGSGVITITNKWVSIGGSNGLSSKQRNKKQDYPELSTNKLGNKLTTTSTTKKKITTTSSNTSTLSMIEKEYDSLSTSYAAPQQQIIGSLSDWARIKPQKTTTIPSKQSNIITNKKQTNNNDIDVNQSNSKKNEISHVKLEDNIAYDNYESSLSYALAQSMQDIPSTTNTTLNYSTVSNTDRNKLSNPIDYPELATNISSTNNNNNNNMISNKKNIKKHTTSINNSIGGWNDAMQSVGLKLNKKLVTHSKLTVVKLTSAAPVAAVKNQESMTAKPSCALKDSTLDLVNLKPIGKLSNDNLFVLNDPANTSIKKATSIEKNMKYYNIKEDNLYNLNNIPKVPSSANNLSPPSVGTVITSSNNSITTSSSTTTTNNMTVTEGKNPKQYGSWVKIGGSSSAHNTTTNTTTNNNTIINPKEYPTLSKS